MINKRDITKKIYTRLGFSTKKEFNDFIRANELSLDQYDTIDALESDIKIFKMLDEVPAQAEEQIALREYKEEKEGKLADIEVRPMEELVTAAMNPQTDGVNISVAELRQIIRDYKKIDGHRAVIFINNEGYSLSDRFREQLMKNLTATTPLTTQGSDPEIISFMINNIEDARNIQFVIMPNNPRKTESGTQGQKRVFTRGDGEFFRWSLNYKNMDLSELGIFHSYDLKNYQDNCFIVALRANGVPETDIQRVKQYITDRSVRTRDLTELATELGRKIVLHKHTPIQPLIKKYGPDNDLPPIEIALADSHYFIYKTMPYNLWAVKNYEEIKDIRDWNKISMIRGENKKGQPMYKREPKFTDSLSIVTELLKTPGALTEYSVADGINAGIYYDKVNEESKTAILDVQTEKIKKKKKKKPVQVSVTYFDTETVTDGDVHIPYMVCAVYRNSDRKKSFIGRDSPRQFLESLTSRNNLVIAHNLRYDVQFLLPFLSDIVNMIKTGNKIRALEATYYGRIIKFIDSYSFISCKLSKFTEMFKFSAKKEVMPYGVYTTDNTLINQGKIPIADALQHLKPEEHEAFMNNINEWKLSDGKTFDHIEYSKQYCLIDCDVLKQGYETFRSWMLEATTIDIDDMISIPQLSNNFGEMKSVYTGCHKLRGSCNAFIQKCVYGGRVMTSENKMWRVNKRVQDFDAVSLYPSAMFRLGGFLKGEPKILTDDQKNIETLSGFDGYFIEIDITDVKINRKFPLLSQKNDDGIRQYSNDVRGIYHVDKVTLEDLIKYQGITFRVVRGYYFNEGRNFKLKEFIDFLFQQRKIKKQEGNPIETVYKLMANSFYGKTIMKPIEDKYVFRKTEEEYHRYWSQNYNTIREVNRIGDEKNFCYLFKEKKPIIDHISMPHCGVEVLSMSKRIMNEVMVTAEDNNLDIFYQDTDSIHIIEEHVEILAQKYKEMYGRDLIGSNLGQFHCDFQFPGIDKGEIPVSIRSVFCGKKSYIDILEGLVDGQKKIIEHMRMKGIMAPAIRDKAIEEDKTVEQLYIDLFNQVEKTFDLSKYCLFKYNKDMTTSNNASFKRTVSFTGDQVTVG